MTEVRIMEQYVVKGGVPLRGEVSIGGAKNAALGILAAAIMTDETVTIENVPNVRDTRVLLQAIEGIGAKVKYIYNNTVQINCCSNCYNIKINMTSNQIFCLRTYNSVVNIYLCSKSLKAL